MRSLRLFTRKKNITGITKRWAINRETDVWSYVQFPIAKNVEQVQSFGLLWTVQQSSVFCFLFVFICCFFELVSRSERLLLGPKAPSLKTQTVCFLASFFGVTDFALWTLIGLRHICCLFITCQASEPEHVATSDLERSYDL